MRLGILPGRPSAFLQAPLCTFLSAALHANSTIVGKFNQYPKMGRKKNVFSDLAVTVTHVTEAVCDGIRVRERHFSRDIKVGVINVPGNSGLSRGPNT